MLLGERQLINAINLAKECNDPPHIIVAMAHHPLHLLQEFDRVPVQNRIERACHFFHCGHLHEPEARPAGYGSGGCLTLGAGASFDTRQSQNTFSFVTLDLQRALRTVTTIHYNPRNGEFSSVSNEDYRMEVMPSASCSVSELAEAMQTYRASLAPCANYLAALLLDQKAELPIPGPDGHVFGSFAALQVQPDGDLKRKTVDFLSFRNALRVLYNRIALTDIFNKHGAAVGEYWNCLEDLSNAEPALRAKLVHQEDDAQMLAGPELQKPFSQASALFDELVAANDWALLQEQAQRHFGSPLPAVAIQAKRMLALSLAHSDDAHDKETAIALYQSLMESGSAIFTDLGSLAILLMETGRSEEAKAAVLSGIRTFRAYHADYFSEIGHRITEALGDRSFRTQMDAAMAE